MNRGLPPTHMGRAAKGGGAAPGGGVHLGYPSVALPFQLSRSLPSHSGDTCWLGRIPCRAGQTAASRAVHPLCPIQEVGAGLPEDLGTCVVRRGVGDSLVELSGSVIIINIMFLGSFIFERGCEQERGRLRAGQRI